MKAACVRSRFDVESAARLMRRVMDIAPSVVEAVCAAGVLGGDFSVEVGRGRLCIGGLWWRRRGGAQPRHPMASLAGT